MNVYQIIITCTIAIMSIIGFTLMGVDKAKAKKGEWRIKEATLFAFAILFGAVGSTLGMLVFRHKTKHRYFAVFFPLLAMNDMLMRSKKAAKIAKNIPATYDEAKIAKWESKIEKLVYHK